MTIAWTPALYGAAMRTRGEMSSYATPPLDIYERQLYKNINEENTLSKNRLSCIKSHLLDLLSMVVRWSSVRFRNPICLHNIQSHHPRQVSFPLGKRLA